MAEFFLISGMALATFGIRYVLWGAAGKIRFPHWLSSALEFVPPAVLTAIIVPAVLITGDQQVINFSVDNAALLAASAAFIFSLWRQNLLLTIVAGMLIFLFFKWGLGLS